MHKGDSLKISLRFELKYWTSCGNLQSKSDLTGWIRCSNPNGCSQSWNQFPSSGTWIILWASLLPRRGLIKKKTFPTFESDVSIFSVNHIDNWTLHHMNKRYPEKVYVPSCNSQIQKSSPAVTLALAVHFSYWINVVFFLYGFHPYPVYINFNCLFVRVLLFLIFCKCQTVAFPAYPYPMIMELNCSQALPILSIKKREEWKTSTWSGQESTMQCFNTHLTGKVILQNFNMVSLLI